jgi:hypothetical protein
MDGNLDCDYDIFMTLSLEFVVRSLSFTTDFIISAIGYEIRKLISMQQHHLVVQFSR